MVAALFAIFFFDLLTPPRDLAALQPTPTATRPIPPTITPEVFPPTPPLLFSDDFSTRTHFPPGSSALPFGYQTYGYRLSPPLDPGYVRVLARDFADVSYHDLSLSATAAPIDGKVPLEYGILFWHSQDKNGREYFLYFGVNTNSAFTLKALEPITTTQRGARSFHWIDIVPPRSSVAVKGNGAPNSLRVDVHVGRVLGYVNDALVLDSDSPLIDEYRERADFDGGVGMIALALGKRGAGALFSRFNVNVESNSP